MHNRELTWTTREGEDIKIKDMTSSHLVNVLNHIEKNIINFTQKYGKKRIKEYKKVITQEIRLRKLNRINLNNNEENLF